MPPILNHSATPLDHLCGDANDGAPARCGYGPRLPLLVISPWARSNYVSHTVAERLGTSWRLLTRYPATWIIAVGLPLTLWTALRPPRPMRAAFDRHPEWRDAMVVLVLASMVAFVGNDTGAAAAGFGFGLAVAGILYLPIAERATSHATRAT